MGLFDNFKKAEVRSLENPNAPVSAENFLHIIGWGDFQSSAGVTVNIDNALGVPAAAQIIDEATGVVQFNWVSGDTNTNGTFEGEFEVTYPDGTIETFPNNGYITIEVTDDIT